MKHATPKGLVKWVLTTVGILVVAVGLCLYLLARDPEMTALFADRVLRPTIGDQATIAIEGFIFGIQDVINRAVKTDPNAADYTFGVNTAPLASAAPTSHSVRPSNIAPFADPNNPIPGEGVWKQISGTDLLTTFIRTDPERPYSVTNLVYIPLDTVGVGDVAGIKHPGGTLDHPGTGVVPADIQQAGKLLAVFNGGFQEKDGHYGMYANGITYVPMQTGLATLFIYSDGHVDLQKYAGTMPEGVAAARQNGPLLIVSGQDAASTAKGVELWAGTASGDYITWRSGLGMTSHGDLVYAVGNSLTPKALADALRLAGSYNGMQLDINNYWVRFILFAWDGTAKSYTSAPLVKGLAGTGKTYLTGYEKDFFYLYKRN